MRRRWGKGCEGSVVWASGGKVSVERVRCGTMVTNACVGTLMFVVFGV